MGAGAGYSLTISDVEIDSVEILDTSDIARGYQSVDITCNIKIHADVKAASYYYTTDRIPNVAITIKKLTIFVPDDYDGLEDVESYIYDVLNDSRSYTGTTIIGGGWSHSIFDGKFNLEADGDIERYSAEIDSWDVINFIDVAVQGKNIQYDCYYNGDVYNGYEDLDEAIESLKAEIRKNVDNAILDDCWVESVPYYIIQTYDDGTCDYDTDPSYAEVEYDASSDPEFA